MQDESELNPYTPPAGEDHIRPLVAEDPGAHQRASFAGLVLWIGWMLTILIGIVWLFG